MCAEIERPSTVTLSKQKLRQSASMESIARRTMVAPNRQLKQTISVASLNQTQSAFGRTRNEFDGDKWLPTNEYSDVKPFLLSRSAANLANNIKVDEKYNS